jgi:hypothetical protein
VGNSGSVFFADYKWWNYILLPLEGKGKQQLKCFSTKLYKRQDLQETKDRAHLFHFNAL